MRLIAIVLAAALVSSVVPAATMKVHSASSHKYTGERISIALRDADIKDVLHAFAKLTGMNIAIDPEVKATVSIDLVDVPWDQALDLILRQNKLIGRWDGNVLRVMPR